MQNQQDTGTLPIVHEFQESGEHDDSFLSVDDLHGFDPSNPYIESVNNEIRNSSMECGSLCYP